MWGWVGVIWKCNFQQEPETNLLRIDLKTKEVSYNPTYEQLFAPEVRQAEFDVIYNIRQCIKFDNFIINYLIIFFNIFNYALGWSS